MKAIRTKFLGATNFKGSRIRASVEGLSVTTSYDHALNIDDMHRKAAQALCDKRGWSKDFVSGTLSDGSMVHVFIETKGN